MEKQQEIEQQQIHAVPIVDSEEIEMIVVPTVVLEDQPDPHHPSCQCRRCEDSRRTNRNNRANNNRNRCCADEGDDSCDIIVLCWCDDSFQSTDGCDCCCLDCDGSDDCCDCDED